MSSPLLMGEPITRQTIEETETAKNFTCAMVNFGKGARTKWHSHTSDQILIIMSGKGVVATEQEEHIVTPGMVAHSPADEKHWHGATPDSAMSHITVTAVGQKYTLYED
jgi:quercetin dioxygenase-like cupin family protein